MRALFAVLIAILSAAPAAAAPVMGRPVDGQLGFQEPATPVMERIVSFHDMLLVIITAISVLILALLVIVMLRFKKSSNPEPAKFSHNTLIEVIWTGVPVLILVVIAIPSFSLLYLQDRIPEADLTVKAVGYQWNWGYEYPDDGVFEYRSYMLEERPDDPAEVDRFQRYVEDPELYRLAVDSPLVVPAGATVRVLVTAGDVIHNWAVPAFGIKMDAIPGRLNETWFRVDEPGTYYGQCSELCGVAHAFMPVQVEVVPQDVYDRWVASAASEGGDGDGPREILTAYFNERDGATRLASND